MSRRHLPGSISHALLMQIGHRIKEFRQENKLTLSALARQTGLTTSFLSQLERNLVSPSVASLEKISLALRVRIADFFQEEKKELIILRRKAGKRIIDKQRKLLVEALASGNFNINMQSHLFTLGAAADISKDFIPPHRETFVMVLRGSIQLAVGSETFVLGTGDSIYCSAMRSPQRIANVSTSEARIIVISFLPTRSG